MENSSKVFLGHSVQYGTLTLNSEKIKKFQRKLLIEITQNPFSNFKLGILFKDEIKDFRAYVIISLLHNY